MSDNNDKIMELNFHLDMVACPFCMEYNEINKDKGMSWFQPVVFQYNEVEKKCPNCNATIKIQPKL